MRKKPIKSEPGYKIYRQAQEYWHCSDMSQLDVVDWFNEQIHRANDDWSNISLGLWRQWMGADGVKRTFMPHVEIKDSSKPRYDKPPKVRRDEAGYFIFGDAHNPYHDGVFLTNCTNLALRWGIRTAVGDGDLFDVTAFATAQFGVRPTELFVEELSEGHKMVKAIADFMEFYLLTGNHEKRFRKFLREQLWAEHFLTLLKVPDNVHFSDYGHTFIEGSWMIGHPRNYSRISLRNPVFISRVWSKYHIVVGHSHNNSIGLAEDGQRFVIDLGMVGEPAKLDWVSMDVSSKPMMQKGALILKRVNGKLIPYLLSPLWTDFDALSQLYQKEKT